MSAVSVSNLTVRYGDILALDDVSLQIGQGTICGLLGMNGSGKSTLFKTLIGVARPHAGEVLIDGLTTRQAARTGRVGYVPQSEEIDSSFPLSVLDVVTMGRYGRLGMSRRARSRDISIVLNAIDRVGLAELRHRPIGTLSGGQRKRSFVARALAQDASVLLLDEPFAGVDQPSQELISDVLGRSRDDGKTILVSTHDLAWLPGLCDEAILLMNRILMHSSVEEVLHPDNLASAFRASTWHRRGAADA